MNIWKFFFLNLRDHGFINKSKWPCATVAGRSLVLRIRVGILAKETYSLYLSNYWKHSQTSFVSIVLLSFTWKSRSIPLSSVIYSYFVKWLPGYTIISKVEIATWIYEKMCIVLTTRRNTETCAQSFGIAHSQITISVSFDDLHYFFAFLFASQISIYGFESWINPCHSHFAWTLVLLFPLAPSRVPPPQGQQASLAVVVSAASETEHSLGLASS